MKTRLKSFQLRTSQTHTVSVDSPQAMDTSTSPRPDQVYLEDEYVSREPQENNTRGGGTRDRVDRADTVSELSDESDSIGTFRFVLLLC